MSTPLIGEKQETILIGHDGPDDGTNLIIDEVERMRFDNQHELVALASARPRGAVALAAKKLEDKGIVIPFFYFNPPFNEERYDWLLCEVEAKTGIVLCAFLILGWRQRILLPSKCIPTF